MVIEIDENAGEEIHTVLGMPETRVMELQAEANLVGPKCKTVTTMMHEMSKKARTLNELAFIMFMLGHGTE